MFHIAQFQCPLGMLYAITGEQRLLRLDFLDDPLDDKGLCALANEHGYKEKLSLEWDTLFGDLELQIGNYFQGKLKHFDIPLDLQGTTFQKEVWNALLTIPYGTTISYGQLAVKVGRTSDGQGRAVASANAKNPVAIIVPCHRVIGADGSLTGYAGGIWRKQALLTLEGVGLPFEW